MALLSRLGATHDRAPVTTHNTVPSSALLTTLLRTLLTTLLSTLCTTRLSPLHTTLCTTRRTMPAVLSKIASLDLQIAHGSRLNRLMVLCKAMSFVESCIDSAAQKSDRWAGHTRASLVAACFAPGAKRARREERALDAQLRTILPAGRLASFKGEHCAGPAGAHRRLAHFTRDVTAEFGSGFEDLITMLLQMTDEIREIEARILEDQYWDVHDRVNNDVDTSEWYIEVSLIQLISDSSCE